MIQRWDVDDELPDADGGFVRYADYLAEVLRLEAQIPTWISVDDELPLSEKNVLAISSWWGDGPIVVRYKDGRWTGEAILSEPSNVIKWMPLPSPPEEA